MGLTRPILGRIIQPVTSSILDGHLAEVEALPSNLITPLWYDFSDSSTVSLTGSLIDSITNKGSASSATLLGVTTTRPVLSSAAINGLDAATFNNLEYMETAATLAEIAQPITWGISWITDVVPTVTHAGTLFDIPVSNSLKRHYLQVSTDSDLDGAAGTNWQILDTTPAAQINIATITYNGSSSRALVNGADIGTGTMGSNPFWGLIIGTNFSKTNLHIGKIGELFAINQNLSNSQLQDLHNYLGAKWVSGWLPISL